MRAVSPHLTARETKAWHVDDKLFVAYLPEDPANTVILSRPPRR